jgi:hypothetical protein
MKRTILNGTIMAAVMMFGSAALALDADEPTKEQPVLGGPKVEQSDEVRETGRMMGERGERGPGQRGQRLVIPPQRWLAAVRELDLNEKQQEAIAETLAAHRKAVAEFQEEHGDRMRELREAMRGLDREDPEAREQFAAMRELREKMPQMSDVQRTIWGVLEEPQREALREKLASIRQEMRERRRQGMERGEGRECPAPGIRSRDRDEAGEGGGRIGTRGEVQRPRPERGRTGGAIRRPRPQDQSGDN